MKELDEEQRRYVRAVAEITLHLEVIRSCQPSDEELPAHAEDIVKKVVEATKPQ